VPPAKPQLVCSAVPRGDCNAQLEACRSLCLENLQPLLCAVVDGEDHDAVVIDGVGRDEGRIRNEQLTSARNSARSARHGECVELLNAGDDLHRDPGGNLLAVRESDVIMRQIQLTGRLLGLFDGPSRLLVAQGALCDGESGLRAVWQAG
jgi:hypothetical protein